SRTRARPESWRQRGERRDDDRDWDPRHRAGPRAPTDAGQYFGYPWLTASFLAQGRRWACYSVRRFIYDGNWTARSRARSTAFSTPSHFGIRGCMMQLVGLV